MYYCVEIILFFKVFVSNLRKVYYMGLMENSKKMCLVLETDPRVLHI